MNKNNFDFLRFVFALMVVLAHFSTLTKSLNTISLFDDIDSYIPVCGFFIISGFLIAKSYSRSKSITDYFKKRANRLLPAYFVIIMSTALLFVFISSLSFSAYYSNKGFYQYLASNLTFLNFLHPSLPGVFEKNPVDAVNGSLWTIKVEVGFYIIIPVLFFLINKFKKPIIFLSILYVLVLIQNFFLAKYLIPKNFGLYFTLSHQLPTLLTYFIAGILLHFYFDYIFKRKGILALIALPVFAFEYINHYQYLLPVALGLLLFYFAYSPRFRLFNHFGKYGDFSYGIYIYHFPIIQLFVYCGLFNFNHDKWLSFLILITLIASAAISSWNYIEKGFLKARVKLEKGNS